MMNRIQTVTRDNYFNIQTDICVCVFLQAEAIHVNPLYVLIPTTLCTSFSFLLPVSNPPNAIVFGYGHVSIVDMVSARTNTVQLF